MIVAIGGDHAGFELKALLAERLQALGHEVRDLGPSDTEPTAVLPFAQRMCEGIAAGAYDRGILVCGTGVGAAIIANKHRGIRATMCSDTYTARQSVEHDDVNVLCLGSRTVGWMIADSIVETFLNSRFLGSEPYASRLQGIVALDDAIADRTPERP